MIRTISHTIEIDAAPEAIWRQITDTAAYPDWNPFMRRLEGELKEGARIEVEIEPPGGREHGFEIEPLEGGRTQSKRFSGLLVRPLGGTMQKTERGFEAMNSALKSRAEAS